MLLLLMSSKQNTPNFSNPNAKLKRSNAFITIKKKPTLRRSNAKVWGNFVACDKPKCEFNGFVFACDDLYCYQNLFEEEEREEDWDY